MRSTKQPQGVDPPANGGILLPSFFLFFSLVLAVLYRLDMWGLASASGSPLSLGAYAEHSLAQDSTTVALLLLLFLLFSVLRRQCPWISYAVAFGLLMLQVSLYLFSSGYYRVFDSAFTFAMLGTGLSSFAKELLGSALAEIPRVTKVQFAALSALLIGALLLARYCRGRLTQRATRALRLWEVRVLMLLALVLLVAPFLFGAPFRDSSSAARLPLHGSGDTVGTGAKASTRVPGDERPVNPVLYLLLTHHFESTTPARPERAAVISADPTRSMRLKTESLSSVTFFPRHRIERGKRYNIIFYVFESTAQKYIGLTYRGKRVTPTWDRLQQNSFVAENHYANYPLSVNAMTSFWSSVYDLPGKRWITQDYPALKVASISEVLSRNGYRTMLLHTGNLDNFYHRNYLKHRKIDLIRDFRQLRRSEYRNPTGWSADDRSMVKPAVRFMKQEPGRPFFVTFFPSMPHHPYAAPEEKFRLTAAELSIDSTPERRKTWLRYLNALHYADLTLDHLLETLKKEDLLENTLLFLFADHGEAFYQHPGNFLHALYLYEENVHVPFLIYNKKMFPRRVTYSGISRHIDIAPTVLDMLRVGQEKEYQGLPLLAPHTQQLALLHTYWNRQFLGLRDEHWKYILNVRDRREELYDLRQDGDERTNLALRDPARTKRYREFVLRARHSKEEFFARMKAREAGARGRIRKESARKRLPETPRQRITAER